MSESCGCYVKEIWGMDENGNDECENKILFCDKHKSVDALRAQLEVAMKFVDKIIAQDVFGYTELALETKAEIAQIGGKK